MLVAAETALGVLIPVANPAGQARDVAEGVGAKQGRFEAAIQRATFGDTADARQGILIHCFLIHNEDILIQRVKIKAESPY